MFYNKNIFFFLILLYPFVMNAQDDITPIIERIKVAKGSEKIDLMNEISVAYRKSDRYKALDFARQAYELSVKINYSSGKALAKKNEGICWFFIGNNDSATLCYRQALDIFLKIGDEKGMSACYNNLGLISQETGKYDEALKYYKRSIEMDQKRGDEIGVAATKGNIVDILIYQGNSNKALTLLNEIIKIYRNQSYKEGLMRALINRAAIYDNLHQYDKALGDQEVAIGLAKELKDTYAEAMALSNSGLVTFHKGKPDEALKMLNQVLGMADGDDGFDILNTLWIMSEIYTSKKEYALSNDILQKVLKKYEAMDNKRGEAKVLTSLGRNLIELNELDKALGYLYKSLEITVELNTPFEKLENYRNLAHAQAILHNFRTADSLQDLFAVTYSGLFDMDSIADTREKKHKGTGIESSSIANSINWAIAFLLFILILIISVFAFPKK